MLEINKVDSIDILQPLKAEYFAQTTAPLDGMWHFGFAPMSQHFGFYEGHNLVGFCCINHDGYLLQFYLAPNAKSSASDLFTLLAQNNSKVISEVVGEVKGAFVSTCDPLFLSLSLDNVETLSVNALLYCGLRNERIEPEQKATLVNVLPHDLGVFVTFAADAIGAPVDWLKEYFGQLIEKQELFGYWVEGRLIASGECRKFEQFQQDYADLGMIVSPKHRGQGIATDVLNALIDHAQQQDLTPMCSTEASNIGAQKAMAKAGLKSKHRFVRIDFK
ncbi:GNAT family N-acetyltransferase [Vibrio sp. LaRot3]|uniref:GNAT family N-acetyltransferase n=1 Tax=Vibrio sp. LaRot3 TaxID=2998829 RepID=UPI0022CDF624|nr:GNAT family N-acetyltransferase [Vibrio sp. LaRot3]MDA0149040.1 GNAT family N-acetyltransferase [Vibrio sp. LaRot3]